MPTAKNELQILNLHPKKYIFQEKNTPFFNANLLEKFQILFTGRQTCSLWVFSIMTLCAYLHILI